MRRIARVLMWFTLCTIIVPVTLGAAIGYGRGWPESWRTADWSSSGMLPTANASSEARVLILAARTGRWKSIFAVHTWIVLKPAGAPRWTRYDVVGWGDPVRRDAYEADARWYGNAPYAVRDISGAEAQRLIPEIEAAIASYPYAMQGDYTMWPGPNSNSFVAWLVRNVPGLETELPAMAVGKDYLGPGLAFARAPSGTGYAVSFSGFIGATAALSEGVELHVVGSTIGIDPDDLAIKLPALGKLGFFDLAAIL